jgi:hypothetical protein
VKYTPLERQMLPPSPPAGTVSGLAIWKHPAAQPRYLSLALTDLDNCGPLLYSTPGAVRGDTAATHALSVGAVSAAGFTGPFSSVPPPLYYSADGPRRIYFDRNGQALTPPNFAKTGGRRLLKPDVAAASEVTTDVAGMTSFKGTSAAAPHVAAIAALVKGKFPRLTAPQVRYALTQSALRRTGGSEPWDGNIGYGVVNAPRALAEAARLSRGISLHVNSTAVIELGADGQLRDRRVPGSYAQANGCMIESNQVVSFALGDRHAAAVFEDGTLRKWITEGRGNCYNWQNLGGGYVSVAAGGDLTVGVKANGTADAFSEAPGFPAPWLPAWPQDFVDGGLGKVVAASVAVDSKTAAFLLEDGRIRGQFFPGLPPPPANPVEDAVAIEQTSGGTIALRADGTVSPEGVGPKNDLVAIGLRRDGILQASQGPLVGIKAVDRGMALDLNGVVYELIRPLINPDYNATFGSLVRKDSSDCANNDIKTDDTSVIGGQIKLIRVATQPSQLSVTVSITQGIPNTLYTLTQKCGTSVGQGRVTTGANGAGSATLSWDNPPARWSSVAFELTPTGSAPLKFETRMTVPP